MTDEKEERKDDKPKIWRWVVTRWYFWLIVFVKIIISEHTHVLFSMSDYRGLIAYSFGNFALVLLIFAFFRFIYLKFKKKKK
ncbi:MAG: hypothetical protein KJ718_01745 [Nanoarchaeota archaeon]|nr:hypothetical protein [Nanoarchaeota archaeon]